MGFDEPYLGRVCQIDGTLHSWGYHEKSTLMSPMINYSKYLQVEKKVENQPRDYTVIGIARKSERLTEVLHKRALIVRHDEWSE